MLLDHEAILRAYPNQNLIIRDTEEGETIVTDHSENVITINTTLVDAARVELDNELYKYDRQLAYPDVGTQLDYIYHNGLDKWKTDIVDPVKAKYPKPS